MTLAHDVLPVPVSYNHHIKELAILDQQSIYAWLTIVSEVKQWRTLNPI
jgi:hypothetical protein